MDDLIISPTADTDLSEALVVVKSAFGDDEVVTLVSDLWYDPSAHPSVSLVARYCQRAIGYVLFTPAILKPQAATTAAILAPLAVIPEFQNRGIGGQLIDAGITLLTEQEVALTFVLGYPEYYTRHGFQPAGRLGLQAPYPIPDKDSDAWMVRELQPEAAAAVQATVRCARSMDQPEYWRE